MPKIEITEETRFGMFFLLGLLVILLLMIVLNYFFAGSEKSIIAEKDKEKTVIVTEAKQETTPQDISSKPIVSSVREALKKGNYSTAYMEVGHVSNSAKGNEELNKVIAEEVNKQRKAPGLRKDAGASASSPIRYFDESTPRNRTADALYIYFVDISGTLIPRFCIQSATKHPLGITEFIIAADSKNIRINASAVKLENTEKGVAEWYDIPLDRNTYEAVQAIIKAKKASLTIIGSKGKGTRNVTDSEIKGIRHILEGYAALGGNLNYMQESKPQHPPQKKR